MYFQWQNLARKFFLSQKGNLLKQKLDFIANYKKKKIENI